MVDPLVASLDGVKKRLLNNVIDRVAVANPPCSHDRSIDSCGWICSAYQRARSLSWGGIV